MKQLCVISCPIDTYSGYGARSRDFVKALYQLKKDSWDIKILSQRWGITPWGFVKNHKEDWGFLESLIVDNPNAIQSQPDVWIQISVPNEFHPLGKFNIGVTAGIETTACDPSWLEGCNRMNLVLTSSNHSKEVFQKTGFEQRDQSGQSRGVVKLEKPVEVLFEGVDLNTYFHVKEEELCSTDLNEDLYDIEENFCFLFVGHWMQGDLGEDRKNVGLLIKNFLETFKDKPTKPALVLKISGAGTSVLDRDEMLKRIDAIRSKYESNNLPNIYLVHGELEDFDMNCLYNHPKIKAMVSLTKGEGFGRPLLEFSLSKKPIIVSAWSGHTDFLFAEYVNYVGGQLKNVHPSAAVQNMILPESQWFSVDEKQVQFYLKKVYENYDKFEEKAKRQAHQSKTNFSFDKMVEKMAELLKVIPEKVEMKLPQLKKIELPNLKKL